MSIWRMRIACWVPKATNTLRMRNTDFPLQYWVHERAPISRHTYTACLVPSFMQPNIPFRHHVLECPQLIPLM